MTKKILAILISVAVLCSLVACGSVVDKGDSNSNTTTTTTGSYSNVLAEIEDLPNYGTSSYANATAITYVNYSDDVDTLAQKILDTQEENTTENNIYAWDEPDYDDSVTTVTRIFCYSDAQSIIDYMSYAAVDQVKMSACVEYIARADATTEYNMVVGVGSAIQDYNEYDELYEEYEETEDPDTYDKLQLKKRKIIAEITNIFGDSGVQFARAAIQQLAYAQIVVVDEMMPLEEEYKNQVISYDDFQEYFKDEMFDYDTLVYFLSYNEVTGFIPTDSNRTIGEKEDLTELFGYYYHYEKNDYEVFPRDTDGTDAEYIRYLELSHLTVLSEDEALEYNEMEMRSYELGYRYSYSFYKTYYGLHFDFQEIQEKYDRLVFVGGSTATLYGYTSGTYDFSSGIGYAVSSTSSYSSEMENGLKVGMEATLMLSDASWVYTSNDTNVITMNDRNTAWNSLSDTAQNANANKILLVLYEREQLIAQYFAMTFNTTTLKITSDRNSTVTSADLDDALDYQIYSASADYIRAIQSYKKEDVLLQAEYDRMVARGASAEELAAKQEEIGRNIAMYMNMSDNYNNANFSGQLSISNDWEAIEDDIMDGISTESDYQSYSDTYSSNPLAKQVDEYFEDKLIVKTWSCGGTDDDCGTDSNHVGCTENYDTNHDLSRLMYNHEATIYHMYGIISVDYMESDYNSNNVLIDSQYHTTDQYVKSSSYQEAMYNDTYYEGDGVLSSLNTKTNTYKTSAFATAEFDTDEEVTIATWNSSKAIWENTYIGESTKGDTTSITVTVTNSNGATTGTYTYYYEFIGWYVDKANLYPVEEGSTFDYDVRLYAGYRITVIQTK